MRIRSLSYFITAGLALGGAAGCSSSEPTEPQTSWALVTFAFAGIPADTIRVIVTDPATIEAAGRYLSTGAGPKMLMGTIVRGAVDLNARYPFHFLPESVRLVDNAIELCDGAPMHTAAAVDDFIQGATGNRQSPSSTWCPWSSYPIKIELPD
jgi:hypothetical protein